MYEKIVFFNHYGHGDIFESREFVKEIMETVEAHEYIYTHGKDHRILLDIPRLRQDSGCVKQIDTHQKLFESGESLFIPTWIGRDSKYVLPGIGCTVEKLYEMYNDMGFALKKDIYKYIPRIDWSYYKIDFIDKLMDSLENYTKVLICNGNVQSNQAYNFDFTPIIGELSMKYFSKNVVFFITSPIENVLSNVIYTGENPETTGLFDLNEIAYLSKSCDIIVGRCSGPSVFCEHIENWNDNTKTALGFTYTYEGSHFVLSDHLPMQKLWSPERNLIGVFNEISKVIDGRLLVK